jgi:hypothetical protein
MHADGHLPLFFSKVNRPLRSKVRAPAIWSAIYERIRQQLSACHRSVRRGFWSLLQLLFVQTGEQQDGGFYQLLS